MQATAAYDQKQYPRCAELFRQASALAKEKQDDEYSAACCHALAGHPDEAFRALELAIAAGFRNPGQLGSDSDLALLRGDLRWTKIVELTKAKLSVYLKGSNPELYRLFTEDQADRAGGFNKIDWTVVRPRDLIRRNRTQELVRLGQAKTSADYFHAAMVMQHGDGVEDIEWAHKYALRAADLDGTSQDARWLAAASEDRWLRRQGKPQKYGTQFEVMDGKWVLAPVDPTITDAERAKWNVPPLAQSRQHAASMPPPKPRPQTSPKAPSQTAPKVDTHQPVTHPDH
jgi:hypothetical protein